MVANPREKFTEPILLELFDRLDTSQSPQEYVRLVKEFHTNLITEGVKTATKKTISEATTFILFQMSHMSPEGLIESYNSVYETDITEIINMLKKKSDYERMRSSESSLCINSFQAKMKKLWDRLSPHKFMDAFREYHWHMWREGVSNAPLAEIISLIEFEKTLGLPIESDEIPDAYCIAKYGFRRITTDGNKALDENFAKDLRKSFMQELHGEKISGKSAITISPDWENYIFEDCCGKHDTQVYWYVHDKNIGVSEGGAVYQGIVLMRKNKALYYDRHPFGGGPYKVKDFTDRDFRRRAEIVAENVEMAFKKRNKIPIQKEAKQLTEAKSL